MSDDVRQKLQFDLSFLDAQSTEAKERRKRYERLNINVEPKTSSTVTRNLIIVAVIIIIIVYFGFNLFKGSSSSSSTPSNQNNVQVGQYDCSSSISTTADSIGPKQTEKTYLDGETARLNSVSNQIVAEKKRLDAVYVDETNQYAINQYNIQVDAYNAKLQQYKTDLANDNSRVDAYNVALKAYNDYLDKNCTKN